MKRLVIGILVLFLVKTSNSQDIHFSEFFATPMFTNPAFTGHFDGTYRFSGVIRNQWASISPQPFKTYGGGIDVKAPFNIKGTGAGLHVAQDVAGLSNLTTSQIHGFVSGNVSLTSLLSLHLGGTVGMFQQSINFSKLSYGDQFNGIRYDPELSTAESNQGQVAVTNLNFGGGSYFEYQLDERQRVGIGYALFNLLQPNRSFFKSTENNLLRRHNFHVLSSWPIAAKWDIMPAAQYMRQGTQSELLFGSAVRYHLDLSENVPVSMQAGLWARTGDAGNISVGLQRGSLFVGGAYDVNFSSLRPATRYRGAWEFTVIYTIATIRDKVKRLRQCPDYL